MIDPGTEEVFDDWVSEDGESFPGGFDALD